MGLFRGFLALLVIGCAAIFNKASADNFRVSQQEERFDAFDDDLPEGVIILKPGEKIPRHEDDVYSKDDDDYDDFVNDDDDDDDDDDD